MRKAVEKYREFHRKEPKDIGAMAASFAIPAVMVRRGPAVHVLYRSDKVDPETLRQPQEPVDYIHDHDAGVDLYVPGGGRRDGELVDVPAWIRRSESLVLLGQCLGFEAKDERGRAIVAEATEPLPELYCTPCGKALLVIEGKASVFAMMWGGGLDVIDRGIIG